MLHYSAGTDGTSQPVVDTPDIGIIVNGEEYLEITAPVGWNSFKTNDLITLMVVNVSNNRIVTSEDFHCRIFVLGNDNWHEIGNKATYADGEIFLEPNKDLDPASIQAAFLVPDLPDYSKPYKVRVFIFGSVLKNEQTGEDVAAFIDVDLFP